MAAQRFEIEQIVAAGTFGAVCRVRDLLSGQRVAAKVLKFEHVDNPRVVARIRDEAALLSRLDHPVIVRVRELVEVHDRPVLLMEWIDGLNLEEILGRTTGGLPVPIALAAVRDVADALHTAYSWVDAATGHQMAVIHRDVKPSNILLSAEGRIKLVDFGTATGRFAGRESETVSMVLGARAYTAPERLDGSTDHPAADVYSLGHVLFELLTGQPLQLSLHPFHHNKMLDIAMAGFAPADLAPGVTADLRRLIERMVAYDPGSRIGHREVAGTLRGVLTLLRADLDLAAYAREHVGPVLSTRSERDPKRHPAYNEVRFLEGAPPLAPDVLVRDFLRRPDWASVEVDLHRLLLRNPGWTAEPFIERLSLLHKPWWKLWGARAPTHEEVGVLLRAIALRVDPTVRARVEGLLTGGDEPVRRLAREILGAGI